MIHSWTTASAASTRAAFSVLQWNVLADGMASSDDFIRVAAEHLTWEHRLPLVVATIKAAAPDVFCLEEATHVADGIAPAFPDYDFVFSPKNYTTADLGSGRQADGVAMFWRKAALARVGDADAFHYPKPDGSGLCTQTGVVVTLELIGGGVGAGAGAGAGGADNTATGSSGQRIVVAATHLKAKPTPENESLRNHQITHMLSRLAAASSDGSLPAVLVGDFNSPPTESTRAAVAAFGKVPLTSVYGPDGPDSEPPITTSKIRPKGHVARCIDYMFHSAALKPVSVLELPTAEAIGPNALPNKDYPSDHLHLAAQFAFVDSSTTK